MAKAKNIHEFSESIIGRAPNQSPRNCDLGSMAFQDAEAINAGRIWIESNPPASATDSGLSGEVTWDADYIYICVAKDTWKRVAIATW